MFWAGREELPVKLTELVDGLNTLKPYYDDKEYVLGAEHDIFYAYATARPLSPDDVQKMIALGWFQEGQRGDDSEFEAKHYDPNEDWAAFV